MKLSYSVKNLRRLSATPSIEIRPITILLGRNSVGKSTYLRSFPLLRQSVETKSSAPILWYGDYVDFGNFKSAVTDNDESQDIEFAFEVKDYHREKAGNTRQALRRRGRANTVDLKNLKISYGVGLELNSTARRYIEIKILENNSKLRIEFDSSGSWAEKIYVNELDFDGHFSDYYMYFGTDSLFTEPRFFQLIKDEEDQSRYSFVNLDLILSTLIQSKIKGFVDNRVSKATISAEARRIMRYEFLNDECLEKLSNTGTQTFQNFYKKLHDGKISKLREFLDLICRFNHLIVMIGMVGEDLSNLFKSVEYIGPARARSERFYRQQELEVSDISPDGRNLPMFLASLDHKQRDAFSDWVNEIFGYGVTVQKTEGHISINLEQNGKSVNVVDTGYGVSQVLPVLAQIWWMQFRNKRITANQPDSNLSIETLVIEQPELHLHPAHQALLADVFVKSHLVDNSKNTLYLVETHSEALVNRLGELIGQGELKNEDVQIVIFSDSDDSFESDDIQVAEFDKNGVLKNWPFGFSNYS